MSNSTEIHEALSMATNILKESYVLEANCFHPRVKSLIIRNNLPRK